MYVYFILQLASYCVVKVMYLDISGSLAMSLQW